MPDRTVVITGASAGVGRALVREFAAPGTAIGLLARGEAGLDAAAEEAQAAGARTLVVPTDVSDPEQVDAAAAKVEAELGPIDVWVNNAMVTVMAMSWDVEPDEYQQVTAVNYLGTVYGTLAALRHMRPRDRGTIVQVGSALAFRGIPGQSPYCASQHALQGFTESLRTELLSEDSRIQVTDVHLPGLNTTQFLWSRNRFPKAPQPVEPIYDPAVAARAIAQAVDKGRRQVWVGASTFFTVWASRLFGGAIDRYLARTNIEGQQTELPADARPADAVDSPVDDTQDYGARGPFTDLSKDREFTSRLTSRPVAAAAGATALAAATAAIAVRRRADRSHPSRRTR